MNNRPWMECLSWFPACSVMIPVRIAATISFTTYQTVSDSEVFGRVLIFFYYSCFLFRRRRCSCRFQIEKCSLLVKPNGVKSIERIDKCATTSFQFTSIGEFMVSLSLLLFFFLSSQFLKWFVCEAVFLQHFSIGSSTVFLFICKAYTYDVKLNFHRERELVGFYVLGLPDRWFKILNILK